MILKKVDFKKVIFFLGIFYFIIIYLFNPPEGMDINAWKVSGLAGLMAIFWIFEVIPIYATALLPLIICPLFGITSLQEAANPFANQIIFLFLGGFLLSIGLESSGLHKRFAMKILFLLGKNPNTLILGFLLSTASLSTLVNNTSTTMMMLPIALSVITVVKETNLLNNSKDINNFSINILLCIAYGSSVGGITTLIGTAPNIFMAGFINSTLGINLGFLNWLSIGVPIFIFGLSAVYITLNIIFFRITNIDNFDSREYFESEYKKLGKWKVEEKLILTIFGIAVVLWIFQPYLSNYFKNITDGVIAMFCALSLFFIPINWTENKYLLDKNSIFKIPWDAILLFGGGLSLASIIEKTKLAEWMGKNLDFICKFPIVLQIMIVITLIIFLTELTSNIATTAVFLPILSSIAQSNNQNPILFIIPATIAASCAFMLPVATPPNAIVYASGLMKVSDMTKAGFILNILFIIIITMIIQFIAIPFLGL